MADNLYGCAKHEEHERRLNELRDAVDDVREKVNELDKKDCVRDEHYDMITKQLVDSNKELSGTLKEVSKTMTDIQKVIAGTNAKVEAFTSKMDSLEGSVNTLQEEISALEKKDSISILDVLKKNAVSILIGIGAIIYYLTQKGVF